MAYIDKHYYTFTYFGKAIPAKDFDRLAQRASEIVDCLTFGKAQTASPMQKAAVKKATAAQMEYLYQQGDFDAYTGNSENRTESETIGNYRYEKHSDERVKNLGGIPVSPLALAYLDACGLRNGLV